MESMKARTHQQYKPFTVSFDCFEEVRRSGHFESEELVACLSIMPSAPTQMGFPESERITL